MNKPLVVIKSTVPPFTTEILRNNTSLRLAVCPEFLTEKHASRDMALPDRVVVGCERGDEHLFIELFKDALFFFVSATEAELVKLLSNAFLVYKVAFSQVAKEICGGFDADALQVLEAVGADRRIGVSHLNPLLGKIPLCSHCLPKDFMGLTGALRDCDDIDAGVFGLLELVRCFGIE